MRLDQVVKRMNASMPGSGAWCLSAKPALGFDPGVMAAFGIMLGRPGGLTKPATDDLASPHS
jgi:hypothetical protein